jgi:Uma2 family endonuclease
LLRIVSGSPLAMRSRMTSAHGILEDVTTPSDLDVPPVRLPGQHELPYEDGVPMESDRHLRQMHHLIMSLDHALKGRDDVYVSGNMFVYFSPRQLKNEHFRGPDVFVVLDTEKKERKSWVLWEEMCLPDVVIELTSPSTRDEDYGPKKRIYERVWKSAVYVIYDPETHTIDAWELDGGRYAPIAKNDEGDVEVAILGLRLGLRPLALADGVPAPSLRWIAADGEPLPTHAELAAQNDSLAARNAALEAELARLRGER